MKASHIPLGAFLKHSEEYISPVYASKKDAYICPTCNKDLIFCKGAVRPPYFRHTASTNPCNYYTNPGESEFHKDAKYRMKELLLRRKPLTFLRTCKACSKYEEHLLDSSELLESCTVSLEHSFIYSGQRKQADVAIIDGPDDNAPISIEICHSHTTCEGDRPDPWFEIDALSLIKRTNDPAFDYRILCMRSLDMCDACSAANNARIITKCLSMKSLRSVPKNDLKLYVRYMLGQREFNEHLREEVNDYDNYMLCRSGDENIIYPPGLHAKFDFDVQEGDNKYNDSLMNRFSQGNFYVMTHSGKGMFWYKIVHKSSFSNECRYKFQEDDECKQCGWMGTVGIILDMLRSICSKCESDEWERKEMNEQQLDEEFNKKRKAAREKWKGSVLKLAEYDTDTIYMSIPYNDMATIKGKDVYAYMSWHQEIKYWSIPLREYRKSGIFKKYGEIVVEEAVDGIKLLRKFNDNGCACCNGTGSFCGDPCAVCS